MKCYWCGRQIKRNEKYSTGFLYEEDNFSILSKTKDSPEYVQVVLCECCT